MPPSVSWRHASVTAKLTPDEMLADDMGRFYDDPLGFVIYAYDWDTDKDLQVCELPEPYSLMYNCKWGPDLWACELLTRIGQQVRANGFDGRNPVDAIREAVSSGHGIGKSAVTAWITNWIMSTRPHAQGTITATTSTQLETKTWAQIAKWTKKCITAHWFDVNTGRGSMKMMHKQYPESWFCSAQTCREENSGAFAGQHAVTSTSFYIFDEAAGVPNEIWEVAEGGLTDGEPMIFAFGNPIKNNGKFFDCFNGLRHRWNHMQVDSRNVQITNKKLIAEWVADTGEDSDFVRVRVRGVFPRASTMQFIPRDIVDEAVKRENTQVSRIVGSIAAIGVDVARFGGDRSVIRTRVERDCRTFPAKKFNGLDTMQLAAQVANHVNYLKSLGLRPIIFVDGGGVGGGVVDRLRQMGFDVIEVQFGGKADDPKKYYNKRSEMYGRLREALPGICLPADEDLITDLTNVEYSYTDQDQIKLERKQDMKRRLGDDASPDDGDALALLWAFPLQIALPTDAPRASTRQNAPQEFDPYNRMDAGLHTGRVREHNPYA